jgi:hypothetical protein
MNWRGHRTKKSIALSLLPHSSRAVSAVRPVVRGEAARLGLAFLTPDKSEWPHCIAMRCLTRYGYSGAHG